MKVQKKNKVDELGDVHPIDMFPITSLQSLRSFLNAAKLGLMHAQASFDGYFNILEDYQNKVKKRIQVTEGRDLRTKNYLEQTCQIIQEAINNAKQADLYINNPAGLFPDLDLGSIEYAFKMHVVEEWIWDVCQPTSRFDAQKIIDQFKHSLFIEGSQNIIWEIERQDNVWFFVSCFKHLRDKLSKENLTMLAEIQEEGMDILTEIQAGTLTDVHEICQRLVPVIKKDFDGYVDVIDKGLNKYKRSNKDVETLAGDDRINSKEVDIKWFGVPLWIKYIQGAIPTFDAQAVIAEVEQARPMQKRSPRQIRDDQTKAHRFVEFFNGLEKSLSKEMREKIKSSSTEDDFQSLCEQFISTFNNDPSLTSDQANSAMTREQPEEDSYNDLNNSEDDEDDNYNQDRDRYY